jgi:hypothetical protein
VNKFKALIGWVVLGAAMTAQAHDIDGNTAHLVLRQNAFSVELSIHANAWTERFKVTELDDEVLKGTKVILEGQVIPLKLKLIEKSRDHYKVHFVTPKGVSVHTKAVQVTFPKELGTVTVTSIQTQTKAARGGAPVAFQF